MKKLILILILSPLFSEAQTMRQFFNDPNLDYNDTTMTTICGFGKWCSVPAHIKPKGWNLSYLDGEPVYGPCQAFIGVDTPTGFIATTRRDHLVGKPVEKDLLDNPQKLAAYVSKLK